MSSLFDPFTPISRLPDPRDDYVPAALDGDGLSEPPPDVLSNAPTQPLLWPLKLTLTVVLTLAVLRLSTLQIANGLTNQVLADGNRIRNRSIEAPRGLILDREGRTLATNQASFALELTPADLPRDPAERSAVYQAVAAVTGQTETELRNQVEAAGLFSLHPVTLLDEIDHTRSLELELTLNGLSGVAVVSRPLRQYETAGTFAHVLGYLGMITAEELAEHPGYSLTTRIGKAGIERTYDQILRGEPGTLSVEVDSRGYRQRSIETVAPQPGQHVLLGIDRALQEKATELLEAALTEQGVAAGSIVGIDPRDGTIRLMVSVPVYDNNRFSHRLSSDALTTLTNDPQHPLTNRAISGVYPPGSIIKPVIAAAGIAEGVIRPETTIDAPAEIRIGEYVFPDWKRHGIVNVTRAIAVSSDVFFYALGGGWDRIRGLGIDRLDEHLTRFGFGERTGIDLPGEATGLVPTPDWKRRQKREPWYIGDTYHLAIGQGDLLATPLQLAAATATIANGGIRWQPRVAEATVDPRTNTRTPLKPVQIDAHVEPAAAVQVAREGMREAVTNGSGRTLQTLPFEAAAKTGTAQFQQNERTHAWFTTFAPYDNPKLALVVLVEGGGAGNEVAAPIAKALYQWLADRGFGSTGDN